MRVHDRADVGPPPVHLGVDRVLAVTREAPGQHLAVEADQQEVGGARFFESDPGGLHPEPAALGIARRHVAPHAIALTFAREHVTGELDVRAERGHVRVALWTRALTPGSVAQAPLTSHSPATRFFFQWYTAHRDPS